MGSAEAMWDALKDFGAEKDFEVFFLSDTTDPELAAIEESVMQDLLRRRPDEPFWYRRRRDNVQKKQGNINDFVQRWGGRYEYMIELDADSMVSPEAMLELVRRADANPRTALIQTLPVIVGAKTFSARAQQLALRVHGGLFGAGLTWWSGGAGNFWGHNAIIRLAPFAQHASLPVLPGREPLGGKILSHDFVEAALLRRAGWRVEIAGDIEGSYEEAPPTLVDLAARDRRWAQGNIQQIQLLFARGFDWLSKVHIGAGVMGYMSGLLWLSLIVMGVFIAGWAKFFDTETTGIAGDPGAGLRLLLISAVVLTSPKWLAVVLWAVGKLPGWGRSPRFLLAVVADLGITTVMAPIVMMNHAGSILSTLAGVDGGWRPQVRDRDGFAWSDLVRHYRQHMIFGMTPAGRQLRHFAELHAAEPAAGDRASVRADDHQGAVPPGAPRLDAVAAICDARRSRHAGHRPRRRAHERARRAAGPPVRPGAPQPLDAALRPGGAQGDAACTPHADGVEARGAERRPDAPTRRAAG